LPHRAAATALSEDIKRELQPFAERLASIEQRLSAPPAGVTRARSGYQTAEMTPPAGSADDDELLTGYRHDLARLRPGQETPVPVPRSGLP